MTSYAIIIVDLLHDFDNITEDEISIGYPKKEAVTKVRNLVDKMRTQFTKCYELLCEVSPDMEGGFILRFLNGVTIQVSEKGTAFPSLNNEAAKEYFSFVLARNSL